MADSYTLSGSVATGQFPPLLHLLMSRLAVGRLEIVAGETTRKLWLDAGQVRTVVSDYDEEKLGRWLVQRGRLEGSAMALALLHQPEGVRFGTHLVQQGLISLETLQVELRGLAVTIVSRLLFAAGNYCFEHGDRIPSDAATLNLTTATLLVSAVRAIEDLKPLEPLFRNGGYLSGAQDAFSMFQKVALSANEGFVLSRITGDLTVDALRRNVPLAQDDFLRALGALVVAGFVVVRETPTPKTTPGAPPPPAPEPVKAGPPPAIADQGTTPAPTQSSAAAPASPIPPSQAAAPPAPVRVVRPLFGVPPTRPRVAPRVSPPKPAVPAAAKAKEASTGDGLHFSVAQEREYAMVVKQAAVIRGRDYYDRLQLSPGATQTQIYMRYHELAEAYHPDRASDDHLRGLSRELAEIFACLTEAYDTLGHHESRVLYDRGQVRSMMPSTGRGSAEADANSEDVARFGDPRQELTAANERRARELLALGQVNQAVELLDQVVRLKPEPATLLQLARLELKNPMWLERAVDHLKHAVSVDPRFTDGWLELAEFWKSKKDVERQRQCLQRILSYEPGNRQAQIAMGELK